MLQRRCPRVQLERKSRKIAEKFISRSCSQHTRSEMCERRWNVLPVPLV